MVRFGAYERTNKTHKCADCPAIVPVSRARCAPCSDLHRVALQRARAQRAQQQKVAAREAAGHKGRRHSARPGAMNRITVSLEDDVYAAVVRLAKQNDRSQSEQIAIFCAQALSRTKEG